MTDDTAINVAVSCVMASGLDNESKQQVIDVLRKLEEIRQAERAEELQDQIDNKILPEIEKGWAENLRFKTTLEVVNSILKEAIQSLDNKEKVNGLEYAVQNINQALKGESE